MAHAAAPAPAATWRRRVGIMLGSLIDQRHVEAHRRLDEIERKLDQMLDELRTPAAIGYSARRGNRPRKD
jgi:hypothetical protein